MICHKPLFSLCRVDPHYNFYPRNSLYTLNLIQQPHIELMLNKVLYGITLLNIPVTLNGTIYKNSTKTLKDK